MSRRAAGMMAALVFATIALAGCVGIPTGGGVQTGELVANPDKPDIVFTPEDPTPGSDPQQLLDDFMLQLRSPQGGFAVAQKYLTQEFAAQWAPNAVTTIRAGERTIVEGGENELLYTFPSRSSVDSSGRYFEQAGVSNLTLSFGFEQENGEWRISRAPDGIVLTQNSFNLIFRGQPLYFLDPQSEFLVPDLRWFAVRDSISARVVDALLEGPSDWLGGGVVITGFPAGTTRTPDGISIEGGVATVQLSEAASGATAAQRAAMRQQLEATLSATLGVSSVVIQVGPVPLDSADVGPPPIRAPQVQGQVVVGTAEAFGFASGGGIAPIDGLSDQVVAIQPTAAVLASDQRTAAVLAGGVVSAVSFGDAPVTLDGRGGLIAPSIDPFDFVWSTQGGSAASITAFGLDGSAHEVGTAISPDAQVVSLDVSRDGTRVLLTVIEPLGPKVYVAGIVRDADNAPTSLSSFYGLDVGLGATTPLDATWVTDRLVAVLTTSEDGTSVTSYEIGGPRADLGTIDGGTSLVGGNFGEDGIRVLANGEVWQHRATGWQATSIEALLLCTQQ